MGFWDAVKGAARQIGNNISESTELERLVNSSKKKILRRLSLPQLKKLCERFGGGPSPWREDFQGRYRVHLTSDHYEAYAMDQITLRTLHEWAENNKVRVDDIKRDYFEEKERITERYHPERNVRIKNSNDELFQNVIDAIRQFHPSRNYHNEQGYHIELQCWMKYNFPNAEMEHQTGSSRPDIVIDRCIAIEVKGPTRSQDLTTIADKCNRYLQHYPNLVVVLFEVEVNERFYTEWLKGIEDHYSNVKIVRK
jgi:hypothetical protein